MTFISSDTNVWIDFATIDKLHFPFLLPYTFLISESALQDEFLAPPGLRGSLITSGLVPTELSEDEIFLTMQYAKHLKLSTYDRMALAIVKSRNIPLLTGDKALRNATAMECVRVIGTLGILDQLYDKSYISDNEYQLALERLKAENGKAVRLPSSEVEKCLKSILVYTE